MNRCSKKLTTWKLRIWRFRYWLGKPFRFLGNPFSRILYDGRFKIPYDIELFRSRNSRDAPPDAWAAFYDVTIERYVKGQLWATAILERVRNS